MKDGIYEITGVPEAYRFVQVTGNKVKHLFKTADPIDSVNKRTPCIMGRTVVDFQCPEFARLSNCLMEKLAGFRICSGGEVSAEIKLKKQAVFTLLGDTWFVYSEKWIDGKLIKVYPNTLVCDPKYRTLDRVYRIHFVRFNLL